MAKAGQTLNDRLNAARYALSGQGLARVVCKATTEEVIGPKKKHLDYLLQCTHEPNISIPQMATLLIERTSHSSWVVVFKALITVHHLMCYGNERFTQYFASSNFNFNLSNFLDKTNIKGYDMSMFIKRYSKYINEKAISYRSVAFDFTKIKRGKEEGSLRTMPSDKLLKTIVVLQTQIDALLEFDCTSMHLTNGVINSAFMLLFRDLLRLFACYNDGIINLLEKFFSMNKKQCREALEIYKKFLIRMDKVAEFLKVAEAVGVEKGDTPDLMKAPSSLLEALEAHLQSLEGKKSKNSKDINKNSASSSTGGVSSTTPSNGLSEPKQDDAVKKALEEEVALMNQFKEKHDQTKKTYNPFLSSPEKPEPPASSGGSGQQPKSSDDIFDLFLGDQQNTGGGGVGSVNINASPTSPAGGGKNINDLLSLNANSVNTATNVSSSSPFGGVNLANPIVSAPAPIISSFNPFADVLNATPVSMPNMNAFNGSGNAANQSSSSNSANFDANFAAVFGSQSNTTSSGGFDAFGDILQPQKQTAGGNMTSSSSVPSVTHSSSSGLIKGDLDSSLASLAQNLELIFTTRR